MENRKFLYIAGGGIVAVIVLIIVLLLVSSCGKKTATQPGTNTLTIWGTTDDPSAFSDIITNFQGENSNVKVTYVKKDSATYLNDSLAEIAAGRGPDILEVPNTWLPKYHQQLVAMPVNLIANKKNKKSDIEVYQSTFPKVVAFDNIINNQIFGMPISSDTLRLYINSDILSNTLSAMTRSGDVSDGDRQILLKGPQNWNEFIRALKLLTKKNNSTIVQSGAALGTANISNANDILTLLMLQNGAKMTSDDLGLAQFQTAQNLFGGSQYPGTKALDFYTSFANPNSANYTWSDTLGDPVRAFAEGKSAMMIGYQDQESDIKRINPNLQYQIINVPQIKETKNPVNYSSYSTFTVTRAAKDSSLAWNFITSTAFMNNANNAISYLTNTKKEPVILSRIDSNSPIITAQSWFIPDPIKTPQIFQAMIKTVNDGKNSQTAVENAASQVTTLLKTLGQ